MGNKLLRSASTPDALNTEYGRAVVTRSNGIAYAAAYLSDGKIHIYEISADKSTVTDRISITPSGSETPWRITLGLFQSDNSIAIAYQNSLETAGNIVRYAKVNTTTWAAPTWENALGTAIGASWYSNFDMDVSDTGMVVIAATYVTSNAFTLITFVKATTGGAWVANMSNQFYSGPIRRRAGEAVSIQCLGVASGIRDQVVVVSAVNQNTDYGTRIYTLRTTESTGAQSGAATLRDTFMDNTIDPSDASSSKRRHVKVWRDSGAIFQIAGMSFKTKGLYWYRASFSNAGGWATNGGTAQTTMSNKSWASVGLSFGMGPTNPSVTYYVRDAAGTTWIKSIVFGSYIEWLGGEGRAYPNASTQASLELSDNAAPFPLVSDQDIVLQQSDSVTGLTAIYDSWRNFANMPGLNNSGIVSLTPADGSINNLANPPLSAQVDTDQKYADGVLKIQFQFASDATFTTSLQSYTQSNPKAQYVNGTDTAGVYVTFSDTLSSITLGKQLWYYRARLVDQWGNVGPWTTTQSFTVGHPPSAIPTSPLTGGYYAWNGGIRTYTWNFSDPSPGDTQSAYQVQVLDSTGTVIQDTAKVVSASQSVTQPALAGTYKDTNLTWQVRLWDSTDTAGPYSTPQQFILTDPPAVTITTPTSGAVASTGTPTYIFTATTGGSRRIKGYTITVFQGANILYAGPLVPVDLASGSTINAKMPPNYLQNNLAYSVQISIVDDQGMVGVSAVTPFTTAWTPPATPTSVAVDISSFDLEGAGYALVTWSDSARAAGFTHWTIYRKDDLVDSAGNVLVAGTFQIIYQDYDTGASYAYRDYLAPANYKVTYAVTQWINSAGQDMESLQGSSSTVIPASTAYWLINLNADANTADTFRMSLVTGDSFTEEQEEAEFTVIGRGRVVNRGQYLGPKGQLEVRLRDTGTTTARQKRLALKALLAESGDLYLRNPFGDVWTVNMSNVAVNRLAGVGINEYCDVTIPYGEVS